MSATPTELAYMAGVLDSDGCISVRKSTYGQRKRSDVKSPSYYAHVTVRQVYRGAVDLFRDSFGGHVYLHKAPLPNGKPLWTWQIHSAACVPVLEAVKPYLRIKRAQADVALESCRLNSLPHNRAFVLPAVDPNEPMVTMAEAARRLGKSYAVVWQAVVQQGNVPHIRLGRRKVLIPESYLKVWADRPGTPTRDPARTAALEACYYAAKELNRSGTTGIDPVRVRAVV